MSPSLNLLKIVAPLALLTQSGLAIANEHPQHPLKQTHPATVKQSDTLLRVTGTLTDDDATLDDGSRYDAYTFEAQAGDHIRISLTSDEFDAVLLLSDLSGELFISDDDSGEGTNAELTLQIDSTGEYEVLANGLDLNERGQYQLTVYTLTSDELRQAEQEIEAGQLLTRGFEQYQVGQFPQALLSFETALNSFLEIGDRANEAIARNNIGLIYQAQSNYGAALDTYEQSLSIAQDIGIPGIEALALTNIGNVHLSQSNYGLAIEIYNRTLARARAVEDRFSEAQVLNNIGLYHQYQGDYTQALEIYQQSLEIANIIEDSTLWISTTGNIATAHLSQGNYPKALELYQETLDFSRQINNPSGVVLALGNIGTFHLLQANYAEALNYYQQNLELAQSLGIRVSEAQAIMSIGNVYLTQGSFSEALDYYQQGLEFSEELGAPNVAILSRTNIGAVYMSQENFPEALSIFQQNLRETRELGDRTAEAITLNNIGSAYLNQKDYPQAIAYSQQGLELARTIGSRGIEALALNSLGSANKDAGNDAQALAHYRQSLSIARELGDRAGEAEILANLGDLFEQQDQPELAIVFFKQSVNTHEDIRNTNQALSQELKDSYTSSIEERYRRLAGLLLEENRLLEAQQVLDLLRTQEIEAYLQSVRSSETAPTELEYWQPEEQVLELYSEVLLAKDDLIYLRGKDFDALTADERIRLQELAAREEELLDSFNEFIEHPDVAAAIKKLRTETDGQNIEVSSLRTLQNNIANLPEAVLIYPLIFEDRLELFLIPPDAPPIRRPIDVSSAELNAAILEYRNILRSPRQDAKPAAQKLYNWLIADLEQDLEQLGAKSIIYSPDGALRYIPLAALHDGDRWLAERFAISHITNQSTSDFDTKPSSERRLLAAACANCSFSRTINDEPHSFQNLPFARAEVNNISEQIPDADILIDADFSEAETKLRLGSYNLIHLATHGAFVSDSPDDSFLVFGDGEIATLREIQNWDLRNADLVVLSACETGLGGRDLGSGIEVLGLGYQIQQAGAKAAIASLWQVNDNGTQILMDNFYDAFTSGMPKAAAVQQAQVNLINGEGGTLQQDLRGGLASASSQVNLPEDQKGARHPHYWAPFILIGNGL